MDRIKIYGASDDGIVVVGAINNEFDYHGGDEGFFIGISDGTLLKIIFSDEGQWHFCILKRGSAKITKLELADKNNEQDYSEEIILEGKFDWVMVGENYAKPIS